jgi:hypothetical protein
MDTIVNFVMHNYTKGISMLYKHQNFIKVVTFLINKE